MVLEGWVSIIMYNLIQNYDMKYAQYAVYPVPAMKVHIWLKTPVSMFWHHNNNRATNLSQIALAGQW